MQRDARQSPARVLAPLALALCTLAVLYVVLSSGSGSGSSDGGGGGSSTTQTTESKPKRSSTTGTGRSTYTVKTGDTLGGIAAKTGVSVEKLQELNPGLDPQALVSGQQIKLRQ